MIIMENIKDKQWNEAYSRIIYQFCFKKYKEIENISEIKKDIKELYLVEDRNKDKYYLITTHKNILRKNEDLQLPLLVIYHCKKDDILMFSYTAKDFFEK